MPKKKKPTITDVLPPETPESSISNSTSTPTKERSSSKGGRPKGSKESREAKTDRQNRKILELRAKNVPVPAIAATVGVSEKTVWNRLKQFESLLESLDSLEEFENNRGAILSAAGFRTLKFMMKEEKLDKASANNLAYVFQQLFNAERLERGKSTSNVSVAQFTKVDTDDLKD